MITVDPEYMIESDNSDDESENDCLMTCDFEHMQALEIITHACNVFEGFVMGIRIRP